MTKPVKEARPERVTKERVAAMEKVAVKSILKDIPAQYIEAQRNRNSIKSCCQDIENLTYQTFKTDGELEKPDFAVMECVCGSKHYRAANGNGKL